MEWRRRRKSEIEDKWQFVDLSRYRCCLPTGGCASKDVVHRPLIGPLLKAEVSLAYIGYSIEIFY